MAASPSFPHILVADDDPEILRLLETILSTDGYRVTAARWGNDAYQRLQKNDFALLLLDLKLPDLDGFAILERMRREQPDLPVVVITSSQSVRDAVCAMKQGALDYVQKPFDVEELRITIQNALEVGRLRRQSRLLAQELARPYRFENIVGDDPRMQQVYSLIEAVAGTNTTVLIEGESGTGKELVAQAIHYAGPRNSLPLVKVNCVTLSESLLESELFGHERGAFTGAVSMKKGLFEVADGGTLFLDEIGEMSPSTQAKLLQFLQDGTFRRVGGTQNLSVDVRVICATNRNLKQMVAESKYREDLYYRLHVFPILLPPLRDRRGDIPKLAQHFLNKFAAEMGKPFKGFSPEALRNLEACSWPGNVRELENAVERAAVLCKNEWVDETALKFLDTAESADADKAVQSLIQTGTPLRGQMDFYEKRILEETLMECRGNHSRAARQLSLNRTTLLAKLKKHGLLHASAESCEV